METMGLNLQSQKLSTCKNKGQIQCPKHIKNNLYLSFLILQYPAFAAEPPHEAAMGAVFKRRGDMPDGDILAFVTG